jgi:hypothetical protein
MWILIVVEGCLDHNTSIQRSIMIEIIVIQCQTAYIVNGSGDDDDDGPCAPATPRSAKLIISLRLLTLSARRGPQDDSAQFTVSLQQRQVPAHTTPREPFSWSRDSIFGPCAWGLLFLNTNFLTTRLRQHHSDRPVAVVGWPDPSCRNETASFYVRVARNNRIPYPSVGVPRWVIWSCTGPVVQSLHVATGAVSITADLRDRYVYPL